MPIPPIRCSRRAWRFWKAQKPRGGKVAKDPDTIALEKRVSDVLGLKVSIEHRDPGGSVVIRYRDLDQLDGIVQRLAKS